MRRTIVHFLAGLSLSIPAHGALGEEVVVIGHPQVPKADRVTVQRIFTGRVVSIGQQAVEPVNLPVGNSVREDFLQAYLEQNDQQYTGYWLVRRYVGKGAPPQELGSVDEVIKYIQATPGAIGYVPVSKVPRGANIVFRR